MQIDQNFSNNAYKVASEKLTAEVINTTIFNPIESILRNLDNQLKKFQNDLDFMNEPTNSHENNINNLFEMENDGDPLNSTYNNTPCSKPKSEPDYDGSKFYLKYKELKKRAMNAYRHRKIFTLFMYMPRIRKSLKNRGWIEKCAPNYLKKIQILTLDQIIRHAKNGNEYETVALSKMLHPHPAQFIWQPKYPRYEIKNKFFIFPIRNRIYRSRELDFTSKLGLIGCIEISHWNTIQGISEVKAPRHFRLNSKQETYGDFDPLKSITDICNNSKYSSIQKLIKCYKEIKTKKSKEPVRVNLELDDLISKVQANDTDLAKPKVPLKSFKTKRTAFNQFNKMNHRMLTKINKTTTTSEPPKPNLNVYKKVKLLENLTFYTRYREYRNRALSACRKHRVFSLYGPQQIRRSLRKRGWLEKLHPRFYRKIQNKPIEDIIKQAKYNNRYETVAISKLLHPFQPDFIWSRFFKNKMKNQFFCFPYRNRIFRKSKFNFTTKIGLIGCIEYSRWNTISGTSELKTPRYHRLFDKDDKEEFLEDFRTTYCISLLIFSTEEPVENVFSDFGSISINVLKFALNRVKAEINRRMHFDIDLSENKADIINFASKEEWQRFFLDADLIQSAVMRFDISGNMDYKRFIKECKECLNEAKVFWPTLEIDGCNNIWILKPANCCRGHGILLRKSYTDIIGSVNKNPTRKYIVQKYIERPLLIYNTKFDIRQYFLVTISDESVSVWIYKDCYLKFSSQEYDLRNFKESIHITNNAVQKKYRNAIIRNKKLPQHNMWHLSQFKAYLHENNEDDTIWNQRVYPAMKRNIIAIVSTSLDETEFIPNSFEIYGCDFILDEYYEPYLLEINATPDMSPSTKVTAKLCPQVLEDLIKVVIDHAENPEAGTGGFELILRTQIPKVPLPINLAVVGKSKPIIKVPYDSSLLQPNNPKSSKKTKDINSNNNNNNIRNNAVKLKRSNKQKFVVPTNNNNKKKKESKDDKGKEKKLGGDSNNEISNNNLNEKEMEPPKQKELLFDTNKQNLSKTNSKPQHLNNGHRIKRKYISNSVDSATITAKDALIRLKNTVELIKGSHFSDGINIQNTQSISKKQLNSSEKVALTLKTTLPSGGT